MKKLVLIFAVTVSAFSLHAQTEQTYTQMFDSIFSNVPYGTVTSGILYDRVANFSAIELFNQQTTDTSSYAHFIQAYSELNRAVTNSAINLQFLLDVDSLKKSLGNISYIPIGIINAKYDAIDTNALHSGKFYESNGLFYVNNAINGSLFIQKQTIIATPLIKQADSVVQFGLSNLFIFENGISTVSNVSINFDDQNGLNNYAIGNTNIVVQYATEGLKTLTIKIHLSNGSTITTYARLQIVFSKIQAIQKAGQCFDTNANYQEPPNITAQIPYLGVSGQAKVRYYRNNKQYLVKPVIIVTGFDPGSMEIFGKSYQRMQYTSNDNLMDELYCLGYDIIIVKFPKYSGIDGGADYIQRNAYTVVEVLNQINQELRDNGSNHQLVIIGPSMGGQITRYALKYMENNNIDHNCRLWISFDSPHQGANMPYGAQAFLDFYGRRFELEEAKPYYNAYLMSPAAKQMLIQHISNLSRSWHTDYYNEINSLGFPSDLRKIAVANGSLNNVGNGYAGKEVLHLYANFANMTAAQIWLAPANGMTGDVFFGKYATFAEWWKWLLGVGNAVIYSSTYSMTSLPNTCCIDATPGGTFPTIKMIKDATDNLGMINSSKTILYQNDHCFMPTKSTLAYTVSSYPESTVDNCHNISTVDLVLRGETPFDSYTGPMHKNMEHVTYDLALANYVRNEIETYIVPGGVNEIPLCETASYSVHLPAEREYNTTITWTCSSNMQIISGQGTKTVTVRAIGMGDGWVCVSLSNLTHNKQLKKHHIKITNHSSLPALTTAPASITQNQNPTWTAGYLLDKPIHIENNATLTISSTVYCTPAAQIIVESGGKLIINGGTFIDACNIGMELPVIVQNDGYMAAEGVNTTNFLVNTNINITSGGSIYFKNGSNAVFTNKTTITVQTGGYICIENGATVNLVNLNSTINILEGAFLGVKDVATACADICDGDDNVVIGAGTVWCECIPFTPPETLTFSNNQSFSNEELSIKNELRITDNSTVTFTNSVLRFGQNAKVIIEPGSKLIIDGTTLTSACVADLWKGVKVWIDRYSSQRGILELTGGSTIENAERGVLLGSDGDFSERGGGKIDAENAHFINNKVAVYFDTYILDENHGSSFTNCEFTLNDAANFTQAGEAQVVMYDVPTIPFTNCTFVDNRTKSSQNDYTMGIYANGSKIRVGELLSNRCQFSGFNRAIHITGSFTNSSRIYATDFTDNHIAIEANGVQDFRVASCTFGMTSPINDVQKSSMGIYLNKSSLYCIENNLFEGQGNTKGIGIVIEGSGTGNLTVKNNTFSNFCIGCLSLGRNEGNSNQQSEGLVFQCNRYENNGSDIVIEEGSRIRNIQSGTSSTTATGNEFINSAITNIYNESTWGVDYLYLLSAPSHLPSKHDPYYAIKLISTQSDNCCIYCGYTGDGYSLTDCMPLGDLTVLESKYIEIKGIYEGKVAMYEGRGYANNPIDREDHSVRNIVELLKMDSVDKFTITRSGGIDSLEEQIVLYYELTNLKHYLDIICYKALDLLLSQSGALDTGAYHTWISRFNTIESDYLLVDSYIALGEFSQAGEILNEMPSKFQELDMETYQNYLDYLAMIPECFVYIEMGGELPPLLEAELIRLSSNNDIVGIKAYALGEILVNDWASVPDNNDNPYYYATYESFYQKMKSGHYCNYSTQKSASGNDNDFEETPPHTSSSFAEIKTEITLTPNPTNGKLLISSNNFPIQNLIVYNTVGEELMIFSAINSPQTTLDVASLHAGIYFLKIITENGVQQTKKFVKH